MLREILIVIAMKIDKMLSTKLVIVHGDDYGVVYSISRLPSRYISWWVGQQTLSNWYLCGNAACAKRTGDRDDECDECSQKKIGLMRRNSPTERKTSSAFQADTSVGASHTFSSFGSACDVIQYVEVDFKKNFPCFPSWHFRGSLGLGQTYLTP